MTNTNNTIQTFSSLLVIFIEAVYLMATMSSNLNVFFSVFLLLGFVSNSCGQSQGDVDVVKNIFLTKEFNSSDSEWVLKSARESYLLLKNVDKKLDHEEKLNFVKNYANFMLKLFKEIQTSDVDVYQVFSKQNSFLKEYNVTQTSEDFNVTELKSKIEDIQFVAERYLVAHYNSSEECVEASEVLALDDLSFDAFLKEKLRADYTEIGYFLLEVFATLIGLSWGLISTVLYYTEPTSENTFIKLSA